MAFKYIILAFFVAFARASYIPSVAVTKTIVDAEYDPNPQYTYSYGVQDALTGDSKSQTETRSGDFVKGQYSLLDSDGTKRVVDYAADPVHGFNAVVSKTPVAAPILAAPAIAKVASPIVSAAPVVAAPTFAKIAAPAYTSYTAPAYTSYAAPAYTSYAAPAYTSYAAPAYTSYAAPVVAKTAFAAPAISSYSTTVAAAGPAVATYAAPAVAAHGYPAVTAYAAPAVATYAAAPVTKTVITGPSSVSYSSPAISYVAGHGVAAPLAKYW